MPQLHLQLVHHGLLVEQFFHAFEFYAVGRCIVVEAQNKSRVPPPHAERHDYATTRLCPLFEGGRQQVGVSAGGGEGKENIGEHEHLFSSTNYLFFCPRISRIYTNLCFAFFNGDLYGRTNHTNAISRLVKIRATEQVAIYFIENVSCKFVRFVGKIKSEDKKTICGQRIHPRLIVGTFHKHAGKRLRAFGLETQQLARNGVIETEAESMEGEAADGVVAVAILDVAADGAAEVLRVDADLVFAPRFEFQFEERIASVGAHGAVVRDGILAAAWVVGRGVGEICLIVFQPTFHRALGLLRLARDEGVVASVGHDVAPVVLQDLLRFERLGIDEQAGGVAVEAMHHVRPLLDVAFVEIIVENSLDAERMVRGGHRKDADALLNNHEVLVFVNEFHEIASQLRFGL